MSALQRHLSTRWIATWLAVFGLVFAPTLSRAMASWGGASEFTEVCSQSAQLPWAEPVEQEQARGRSDAEGKVLLHLLASHCPLCAVASGTDLAPPPAPFALWLNPTTQVDVAGPVRALPVDLAPRTRPQPRAPPRSA